LHAAAFDERAAGYDADFTNTPLGSALRTLVWARLDRVFTGAQRVLDLGCGTGEDAGTSPPVAPGWWGLTPAAVRSARGEKPGSAAARRAEFRCCPSGLGGAAREVLTQLYQLRALNCGARTYAVSANLAARLTPGGCCGS
jgi:hypothetical protein